MPRLREFRYERWAQRAVEQFKLDAPSLIAIDTETTGLGFYDEPFGATITWRHPGGWLSSWYFDTDTPTAWAAIGQIMANTPAWVGHNLKFDMQKLTLLGILEEADWYGYELHDTATLYHLLDENGRKGLKHLAVTVLQYDDTIEVEVKSGPNKGTKKRVPKEEYRLAAVRRKLKLKKEDGYHLLPRHVLIPYALRDTEFTLRLFEQLHPRVEKAGLLDWYGTEMDLARALLWMESDGLALDMDYLDRVASEYGVLSMRQWQRVVDLTGNPELNLNSPAQIIETFKSQRGILLESTGEAVLTALDDELANAIIEYRGTYKVYKTYLMAMKHDQRGGLIHPSFNPTGARTGRLSSGSAKE
jgi:DNA polymerase I-like protein with 3'-5' exonuclease and polymerase domains